MPTVRQSAETCIASVIYYEKKRVHHKDGEQDAQLSQRDRAAGCVSFGQK